MLALCGLRFQSLTCLSDIRSHLSDFDVLVRLGMVVFAVLTATVRYQPTAR